jgi:hypothetical protein
MAAAMSSAEESQIDNIGEAYEVLFNSNANKDLYPDNGPSHFINIFQEVEDATPVKAMGLSDLYITPIIDYSDPPIASISVGTTAGPFGRLGLHFNGSFELLYTINATAVENTYTNFPSLIGMPINNFNIGLVEPTLNSFGNLLSFTVDTITVPPGCPALEVQSNPGTTAGGNWAINPIGSAYQADLAGVSANPKMWPAAGLKCLNDSDNIWWDIHPLKPPMDTYSQFIDALTTYAAGTNHQLAMVGVTDNPPLVITATVTDILGGVHLYSGTMQLLNYDFTTYVTLFMGPTIADLISYGRIRIWPGAAEAGQPDDFIENSPILPSNASIIPDSSSSFGNNTLFHVQVLPTDEYIPPPLPIGVSHVRRHKTFGDIPRKLPQKRKRDKAITLKSGEVVQVLDLGLISGTANYFLQILSPQLRLDYFAGGFGAPILKLAFFNPNDYNPTTGGVVALNIPLTQFKWRYVNQNNLKEIEFVILNGNGDPHPLFSEGVIVSLRCRCTR